MRRVARHTSDGWDSVTQRRRTMATRWRGALASDSATRAIVLRTTRSPPAAAEPLALAARKATARHSTTRSTTEARVWREIIGGVAVAAGPAEVVVAMSPHTREVRMRSRARAASNSFAAARALEITTESGALDSEVAGCHTGANTPLSAASAIASTMLGTELN